MDIFSLFIQSVIYYGLYKVYTFRYIPFIKTVITRKIILEVNFRHLKTTLFNLVIIAVIELSIEGSNSSEFI